MDYQYENLDPERFQELCQALLLKEYPGLQCFPVAQPDGGRDAVAPSSSFAIGTDFIVFQVKFRRNVADTDAREWLFNIVRAESDKLRNLLPIGAKQFVLMTNVPGTSHPGVGSIDLLNALIAQSIDIPALMLWRDDLNRRLDTNFDLKWMYPELLSGSDALRMLIQEGLTGDRERRATAVKSFVRAQYEFDREVKFKQVDLRNELLDLFIDVPIAAVRGDNAARRTYYHHGLRASVGAASLFLSDEGQREFPFAVLEGAPGQGKSTLAQYICQVHRMRLLGIDRDIARIPEAHRNTPVRLPLRVDLRDFATWIRGNDPFSAEEHDKKPEHWHKSLEAFLAALIAHSSGGCAFTVDDLHAVGALSAMVIVLDGLDEVADTDLRNEVVFLARTGAVRLRDNAASLQVLVTSRPAAFANSPGFPRREFQYLQLGPLTKELIREYGDRWLSAGRIDSREATLVRRILRTKIEQQHLMALAQNPMQLTILLSLIHSRGSSLPDKRTALYDSYVDLFFDREAEKTDLVREHRDLMKDLHGHLAWVLHCSAETGGRGSLSEVKLRKLVGDYLQREERDVSLVAPLFTGVVERVFFLVSRIEGTFEFEVQPLREYFAGRYLFESAPYSPPGNERRGTRPDRFDALARNFYWLNVARFFAGCFSKGELPSLIDRLQELAVTAGYRDTNHPARLASMLLSDWVFSQSQRSLKQAVALVLDSIAIRNPLLSSRHRRTRMDLDTLSLPEGSGRAELVAQCALLLANRLPADFVRELVDVLRDNASSEEINRIWITTRQTLERPDWLSLGLVSGALMRVTQLARTDLEGPPISDTELTTLMAAGRIDIVTAEQDLVRRALAALAENEYRGRVGRNDLINVTGLLLDAGTYAPMVMWGDQSSTAFTLIRRFTVIDAPETLRRLIGSATNVEPCERFVEGIAPLLELPAGLWTGSMEPWDAFSDLVIQCFGDCWAAREIANVVPYMPKTSYTSRSLLVAEALEARRRAASVVWWRERLERANTRHDTMAVLLSMLSWASVTVLGRLLSEIDERLSGLAEADWHRLHNAVVRVVGRRGGSTRSNPLFEAGALQPLSARLVVLASLRLTDEQSNALFKRFLERYEGTDSAILRFMARRAFAMALKEPELWNTALAITAKVYEVGSLLEIGWFRGSGDIPDIAMPIEVAQMIVSAPTRFPRYLVQVAAERCRYELARHLAPMSEVARADRWFDEAPNT